METVNWRWYLWVRVTTRAPAFGMNPSTDSGGERKGNVNNEPGGTGRKEKEMRGEGGVTEERN